jgi:hypothetical protein
MLGSQAQRSRPISITMPTTDKPLLRDRYRVEVAFGATIPDAMAGPTSGFAAVILGLLLLKIGCTDPGGARAEGRLNQARLPNAADLLPEIAIL